MGNVTVIGAQWGDEGKGKIVDWLSARADVVVRFQGGHNAGHTLVVDGTVYKLSLLPSGVVRQKTSVIGNGVVVDPQALLDEIGRIEKQGVKITPEILWLADTCPLILPVHTAVDQAREVARGSRKIGTTGRGIGPAYEDKVGRRAIRVGDLREPETLKWKVSELIQFHNAFLKGLGAPLFSEEELMKYLTDLAPKILPFARPAWRDLHEKATAGDKILFEGAQGIMLDVDHGTYPYVTSSNTVASNASTGSGVTTKDTGYVLGITKAYVTRVGSGPFPSEQENDIGKRLGERGHEFGTVTGRPRRCGWIDAVLLRHAVHVSSINGLALTKLDVLDGFDKIGICVGYELNGEKINYFPTTPIAQNALKPIFEYMPGWTENTAGITELDKLPQAARNYIKRIEELSGAPVALLSTSPEREDTILLRDPFGEK